MYCKVCGATLAPGDVFCKNCGAANNVANDQPVAPTVEPIQPAPQPMGGNPNMPGPQPMGMNPNMPGPQPMGMNPNMPGPQPMMPQQNYSNQQPNFVPNNNQQKSNGKGLLIIGIVVAVLAVAVIGYLIFSSLNKKNEENPGGGSTVVVTKDVQVEYKGYVFSVPQEYIATVTSDELTITASNFNCHIEKSDYPYSYISESKTKSNLINAGYSILNAGSVSSNGHQGFFIDVGYSSAKATMAVIEFGSYAWGVTIQPIDSSRVASNQEKQTMLNIVTKAKKGSVSNAEGEKIELPDNLFDGAEEENPEAPIE